MLKKIFLYNLSLLPLYIIYYIKLADIKIFYDINTTVLYIVGQQSIIFLILIAYISFSLWVFNRDLESDSETLPIIINIERKEYDYFTFLSVFILPLFALSLDGFKDWIVLVVILSFMGIIYIRGDFLYLNPIFLLFGWYLYKGDTKGGKIIFLADNSDIKNEIQKGYHYKIIDKNFVFLKRMKSAN